MKGSVDRIEDNNIAVIILDDNSIVNIPVSICNLKQGDRIEILLENQKDYSFIYNNEKYVKIEDDTKQKMIDLQNKIFGKRG